MVKHLSWFVSKRTNPKVCYRVNIKDEIDKFKEKNPDRKPVVIFDFIGTIPMLFEHELEAKCAGRQGECLRRAEIIFKKFREFGIEMSFFLDGPLKKEKISEWCRRRNGQYETIRPAFQDLKHGEPIAIYFQKFLKSYYENYLRIAKKYGKIFISFENECDIDIAEYASRIRPLAVFAYDSDFLIMPADWPIWLPSTLKIETFTVNAWNKGILRKALGLTQFQMPIFATLAGNDWIELEHVQHIHDKSNDETKLLSLAKLIRDKFPKNGKKIDSRIITDLIYNDGKCKLKRNEVDRLVKLSLNFYDYSSRKTTAITPEWLRDHIFQTAALNVFIMYNKQTLHIPQPYIDLSKNDVSPYADLVLPLLRREMGILNAANRDDEIEYDVCLKPSDEEPYEIRKYTPIYPDFDVPPLEDILDDDEENTLVPLEKKIQLLGWIVSPPRKTPKLKIISDILETIYIIPSIILNYLVQARQISLDEADIVLLTIYETFKMPDDKAMRMTPPEILLERPFWLSFTYTNIVRHFEEAMTFCGLYEFVPNAYFDGYIFHKMYSKFLVMEFEKKKEILKPVLDYRLYVL